MVMTVRMAARIHLVRGDVPACNGVLRQTPGDAGRDLRLPRVSGSDADIRETVAMIERVPVQKRRSVQAKVAGVDAHRMVVLLLVLAARLAVTGATLVENDHDCPLRAVDVDMDNAMLTTMTIDCLHRHGNELQVLALHVNFRSYPIP
jgi:hypothetical protein